MNSFCCVKCWQRARFGSMDASKAAPTAFSIASLFSAPRGELPKVVSEGEQRCLLTCPHKSYRILSTKFINQMDTSTV